MDNRETRLFVMQWVVGERMDNGWELGIATFLEVIREDEAQCVRLCYCKTVVR